jgi:hypothetical protein
LLWDYGRGCKKVAKVYIVWGGGDIERQKTVYTLPKRIFSCEN